MSITATHEFDIRTDCWGPAERMIADLTSDQLDTLEMVVEDYFAGMTPSDVEINNFISYSDEVWEEWIGISDEDEFEEDEFEESVRRPARRSSRRLRTESVSRTKRLRRSRGRYNR